MSQKWVRIKYLDREGYVPEEHVRSPVEQAACFVKSANGWRMTAFAPRGRLMGRRVEREEPGGD